MRGRYRNSFREKIRRVIAESEGNVILRSELTKLGSSRQISRALKALVEDGELIKFGYGVYAKAEKSEYVNMPILQDAFENVCIEALNKLGIGWELGMALKAYNEGRTQQVPVKFIVRLKNRFRGTLGDGRRKLVFERKINAR